MCDTPQSGRAKGEVLIENDTTRVTKWQFEKRGDNTGWHRHAFDYVVVPLFDGQLEIDNGGGETSFAQLKNGVPYFRELGVEHDVINGNDFECAFIEIEFLRR